MIKKLLVLILLVSSQLNAQVEIYNEDFQNGLPATYTIVDNDGFTPNSTIVGFDSAWVELVDPMDSTDTIVGSTSYFSPTGQADRWLITPPITIGGFGNILYWNARSHDPSFPDDYFVLISTTDTQLSSFTDTLYAIINELGDWQTRSVNISDSGYVNQTVHIAFVNRTYDGFKLYIDDIRMVKEDPVGLDENNVLQLSVYPNPTNDFINISGLNKPFSTKIYSISGELLLTSENAEIDVSHLAKGQYILVTTTDEQSFRKQLIKY